MIIVLRDIKVVKKDDISCNTRRVFPQIIVSSEEVNALKSKFETGQKSKEIKKNVEKIEYEGLGNIKGKFEGRKEDSSDAAAAEKQRKIQVKYISWCVIRWFYKIKENVIVY